MELPRTPSFRLDGKRALVTGAGRGIGLAAAAALADAGAEVFLVARTETEIAAAAAAMIEQGGQAHAAPIDVTDRQAVESLVRESGPFHVLVNNAGTNRPAPCIGYDEADFDAIMNLNVRAAYFVASAVASALVSAKEEGSIINVSSQMGHVGSPTRSVYCTSKHAIEGLTKAMAVELAPYDIRVNSIGPTYILTAMTAPNFENEAFRDDALSRIPLGRIGRLEDIMGTVVFLASPAAALITGTCIIVDGGWTAQ